MRNFIFFVALALLACNQNRSGGGDSDTSSFFSNFTGNEAGSTEITCWGIGDIDLEDDMEALTEKVGAENLSQDSLWLEGQFEAVVTTVWPDSPQEIVVHWKEKQAPYKTIDYLEISRPESPYHFVNGIKTGMTLDELVALNGGTPVKLYGFGWDYGGTFIDFNKGKLSGDLPCFGGVFALSDSNNMDPSVMGDKPLSSSNEAFKNNQPILRTIRLKRL